MISNNKLNNVLIRDINWLVLFIQHFITSSVPTLFMAINTFLISFIVWDAEGHILTQVKN